MPNTSIYTSDYRQTHTQTHTHTQVAYVSTHCLRNPLHPSSVLPQDMWRQTSQTSPTPHTHTLTHTHTHQPHNEWHAERTETEMPFVVGKLVGWLISHREREKHRSN